MQDPDDSRAEKPSVNDRIHITDDTFLLVLTGAGVSAESGLQVSNR